MEGDLLLLCRFLKEGVLAKEDQNDLGGIISKSYTSRLALVPVRSDERTLLYLWTEAETPASKISA